MPRAGGRLAQSVERFVYTEDVGGSNPSPPTIKTDHSEDASDVPGGPGCRRLPVLVVKDGRNASVAGENGRVGATDQRDWEVSCLPSRPV